MEQERIVVTGGAGFIGSHLCQSLLEDGHEVIALDNLVSGKKENMSDFFYHDNFTFHEHDVTNFLHINGELDWVLHLASLASPIFYDNYPIKTLKAGALGTHKTLGLAKDKDANYLFTSTSEVYGDPEVNPQSESYRGNVDPFGPRSCYDESKRYAEAMCRAYHEKHGINIRIARIFNTYGPKMRQDDGRVIPNFIKQALAGDDLTIYGEGAQTRSFCYISDMTQGLKQLMSSDYQQPINLGNTREITIKQLAQEILDITDSNSGLTYQELPPQDPEQRQPDITKAKQELNWQPEVELEQGLKRTIADFKQD